MMNAPHSSRTLLAASLLFVLTGMTRVGRTEAVSLMGTSWFSSSAVASSEAEAVASKDTNVADVLVSPIINRELETSIVAHSWPTNEQNIFCEAYAYHQQQDNVTAAFQFLSNINSSTDDNDGDNNVMNRVLMASPLSQSHKSLLKYFLATRAFSPLCESHRGLARQALAQSGKLSMFKSTMDVFAVVYPSGKVLFDSFVESYFAHDRDEKVNLDLESILLPDEPVLGGSKSGELVVLYANMGTKAFQKAFQALTESQVRFAVRHLGIVDFEDAKGIENSNYGSTILQGYGVRLDIRNLEYKVFDDRSGAMGRSDGTGANGLVNLTSKPPMKIPKDFLAGVNLTALGISEGDDLLYDIWKLHGDQQAQESIIPPLWQRRNLGVQAATAIASSKDPLAALEEISQNLPSLASTLVHVQVDENIRQGAQFLEEERMLRTGRVYVDGRAFALDRPTFNLFELLNLLKTDQEQLEVIENKLGPLVGMSALADIKKAWASGNDFLKNADDDTMQGDAITVYRIDVHKGIKRSIMYLNDVESDPQYAQWTKSLRQMFMNMQFGMPPAVRRNLFTIMAVIDPAKKPSNGGLSLGFNLIQSSYPARVGVLVVDADDVSKCGEWLVTHSGSEVPCPTKDILPASTKQEDLVDIPASAHAVHRLISHFDDLFGNRPGALQAYVEYLTTTIAEQSEEGDTLTISELLSIHGMLMEGMRLYSASEAERKALIALKEEEDVNSKYSYGAALHFAASKRLKPGMSFLNGKPLPESDEELGDAFQDEQNFIFGLIMKGEISDSAPRSVYNKLLTGDNVFSKCHPLLLEESTYKFVDHANGPESLLFAPQTVPKPEAHFVLDVYLDIDSEEDITFAESVLRVMEDDISTTVKRKSGEGDVKLGYRFISSNPSSASNPLCPILAQASLLGANSLRQLLHDYKLKPNASIEDLLKSIPNLSQEARERILAIPGDVCTEAVIGRAIRNGKLMIGNGRVFEPEGNAFTAADLDLLLSLEFEKAHAVTELLGMYMGDTVATVDAVGKVAAFLAEEGTQSKFKRSDPLLQNSYVVDDLRDRLLFSWNDHRHIKHLVPSITVIVDPLSEAAQRISSLLKVFRDELKFPVRLLLFPRSVLDGDSGAPVSSYYRFVGDPNQLSSPKAYFSNLPLGSTLTLKVDVPEPWNVQQTAALQDTDNLRCDLDVGCGDQDLQEPDARHMTRVEYGLKSLLFFGQCYETSHKPPAGLQLTLSRSGNNRSLEESGSLEIGLDGSTISTGVIPDGSVAQEVHSDTVVMNNVGYWQLQADAGVWDLEIAKNSKGAAIFDMMAGNVDTGRLRVSANKYSTVSKKRLVMKDFINKGELLIVRRRAGFERASLFDDKNESTISADNETINVFSLATGHLYERFLKIMMLSVTKRTSTKVKFWLFENFLSPSFKATATAMAEKIGCEVQFVTYKWPEWLRDQSEKQRTIWGYKILFLDVLFPLDVKKIIYVDADQVVRGDLKELWDMDLQGAPYGYTPFCTSREATLGYQFWREGFWKQHLQGKPYHISALYVVDLDVFRKTLVGDKLRATYQSLSADPNSLANLDQDLPNYAQHQVPIFSLPQEWLWCESWCSDETKETAKTIDLCNNPMHKEPKVSMAKRVISGPLFNESWVELDAEVGRYEQEYWVSLSSSESMS